MTVLQVSWPKYGESKNTLFIEIHKFTPLKFIPCFFLHTTLKYHKIIQNTN